MLIPSDHQQSFINRAARFGAVAILGLAVVIGAARDMPAASAAQTPAKGGEVMLYSAADESSAVIETVRDGAALAPIAEMTGTGGTKWFMVKSKSGNVGWIKASDNAESRRIDDHFRALPKDSVMIGPSGDSGSTGTNAPAPSTKDSATGAISIPVKMIGNSMVVPVTFSTGAS
ncbi:MAG TPA: hypothetical protein VNT76_14025, partial [Candidatus Binatus sp.]|nr:hypothetical protein [Candidatus Binatus sp.]